MERVQIQLEPEDVRRVKELARELGVAESAAGRIAVRAGLDAIDRNGLMPPQAEGPPK